MQKEARPTVCQVFPAGDSSLGEGCSGRTLAWRKELSGEGLWSSRGMWGDLPKKLKNWHAVVKGGPYGARRRTWVKLPWDWIETLG